MRCAISILLFCTATSAAANTCGRTTQVQEGEIFGTIAERCGVSTSQLLGQNPTAVPTDLSIGQIINVENSGGLRVRSTGDPMWRGDHEYLTEFLGAYSPQAICSGQEVQLDLTPDTVTFGETRCAIKTIIYDGPRQVTVNLGACMSEGEIVEDRFINLSLRDDRLTYEQASAWDLQRCIDR